MPPSTSDSKIDKGTAEAFVENANWTDQKSWCVFVEWMQVYGCLDPSRLELAISEQLGGRPESVGVEYLPEEETFILMVCRLAVFEAALVDASKKKDCCAVMEQIQQNFPRLWPRLGSELTVKGPSRLINEARKLCEDEAYRRKADAVVGTFHPKLVGVTTYVDIVKPRLLESCLDGQEAVGPALFRTTMRASSRALIVAASMQTTLTRLVEEEKINKKAAVEMRALPEGRTATAMATAAASQS